MNIAILVLSAVLLFSHCLAWAVIGYAKQTDDQDLAAHIGFIVSSPMVVALFVLALVYQ